MKRRRRGYVLLFVLFLLLVMSLGAAGYYSMTSRSELAAHDVMAQELAVQRAEFGAERALLDVRSGGVSLADLTPRATPDGVAGCGGFNCIMHAVVDNGRDAGLAQGGGRQWDYLIYKSDQVGTPAQRYTIQATGYYGFAPTSVTYATARVEMEIDVGTSNSGGPTDPNNASGRM